MTQWRHSSSGIRRNFKNFYFAVAVLCTVVAAITGCLVFILENVSFIGNIVIFWCVSTAIIVVVTARLHVLTISEAGLKIVGGRPIPWDQIEEISIGSIFWSKRLFIKFVDPRRFICRRPFFWFWQLFFGSGDSDEFFVPLSGSELKPEEICFIIQKRLKTHRTS